MSKLPVSVDKVAQKRIADSAEIILRNLPLVAASSIERGKLHGLKAIAARKIKLAVTGAQMHSLNYRNQEQVADYIVIDNQQRHSYAYHFWKTQNRDHEAS